MLPLRSAAELATVEPDYDAIAALLAPIDATCVYPFAIGGAGSAEARAFTGSAKVAEDPATGRPPDPCARTSPSAPVSAS